MAGWKDGHFLIGRDMNNEIYEYLQSKVGKYWLKDLNDEQISFFIDWARKCQIFKIRKDDPDLLSDIGDAFRGFVIGLSYTKKNIKKFNAYEINKKRNKIQIEEVE